MNIEWPRITKPKDGGSAVPRQPNIEHEIPANVSGHIEEDAEQLAVSAYRWRRRLLVINIAAWILIILAIRAIFF
jgi:hypothetical protein